MRMRNFLKFTAFISLLLLASCNLDVNTKNFSQGGDSTMVHDDSVSTRAYDGLTVVGNQLRTAWGDTLLLRGVNMAWAWYRETGMGQLEAIGRTGANAVRVVLADGGQWPATPVDEVAFIVEECRKFGMIAILEAHDETGNDSTEALLRAARYFADMASYLSGTENFVIINIANEWMKACDDEAWANSYERAISLIRSAGLKHCIMVDSNGYGQGAYSVIGKGTQVLASDPERNVIFSVHMYGTAGNSERVRPIIDQITKQDLALCIGEFGWYHSDGDVDEDLIMACCDSARVGWLAWSWYGNSGGVEYLDLVKESGNEAAFNTPLINDSLSCEWGRKVIEAIRKESVKKRL